MRHSNQKAREISVTMAALGLTEFLHAPLVGVVGEGRGFAGLEIGSTTFRFRLPLPPK